MFDTVKVFTATKQRERDGLGEEVTAYLRRCVATHQQRGHSTDWRLRLKS